jgi:peptide/nickel transport system ATP-binding protein
MLDVTDLAKTYSTGDEALKGVSLSIGGSETVAMIGPSGAGKSTFIRCLNRLTEPTAGTVELDGTELTALDADGLRKARRDIGMIFQEYNLVERLTVMENVLSGRLGYVSTWRAFRRDFPPEDVERAFEILDRVGLEDMENKRVDELSGGQRQRVGLGRALMLEPDFLVLDEPVSALDVSVQARIINLLERLQADFGLTYLFIAHDLSVVRHISDRVAVMYLGNIVESGPVDEIFESPRHPYTEALLESVPRADVAEHGRDVEVLEGDVPSPRNPPTGCRFRTRCPQVIQPEGLAMDQADYRAVMDLRERLEAGELTPESARSNAADALDVSDPSPDQVHAWLRDELDLALSGANATTVEEALERLAEGDHEGAVETLHERFESVCERQRPGLGDTEHPAACHLFDDATARLDERLAAEEGPPEGTAPDADATAD